MRADRLLSIMILLQTRGRMTAKALATACEVSERTIYRDIDALSAQYARTFSRPGNQPGITHGHAQINRCPTGRPPPG